MTTARQHEGSQRAAYWPPLLDLKRVSVLVDAAMHLFSTLYDIEREAKRAVNARLKAEVKKLDLFGPQLHYTNHEDYAPSGGEDR